jgi:predicted phosphodiesterase
MNILVLSDLHIDTGDTFGTFQWNEQEFIHGLEKIRRQYNIDKVIFNGDTFELFKYSLDDIARAKPVLMKYLGDKDFIFIRGNHDIVASNSVENYRITNSSGQVIHIEHGHNADWFNGNKAERAIGQMGFSILKKGSGSKFMMDLYFRIVALQEHIHYVPKKYNTIKYLTYALSLLKEHDVVILAHTHKMESHHTYYLTRKKRYLNCGSCSLGRLQCIVLNTETLRYELINETKSSVKEVYRMSHAIEIRAWHAPILEL